MKVLAGGPLEASGLGVAGLEEHPWASEAAADIAPAEAFGLEDLAAVVGVAAETAIAGAAVSEEREGCSLAWAAAGVMAPV